MPANKAPCRLMLRVGTIWRRARPLASIPAIRTCSLACTRGSRRFPNIAPLLSRLASTAVNYGAITVQEPAKTTCRKGTFLSKAWSRHKLTLSSANKIATQKRGGSSDLVALCESYEEGGKSSFGCYTFPARRTETSV